MVPSLMNWNTRKGRGGGRYQWGGEGEGIRGEGRGEGIIGEGRGKVSEGRDKVSHPLPLPHSHLD